jgi:hypothetical protein
MAVEHLPLNSAELEQLLPAIAAALDKAPQSQQALIMTQAFLVLAQATGAFDQALAALASTRVPPA